MASKRSTIYSSSTNIINIVTSSAICIQNLRFCIARGERECIGLSVQPVMTHLVSNPDVLGPGFWREKFNDESELRKLQSPGLWGQGGAEMCCA